MIDYLITHYVDPWLFDGNSAYQERPFQGQAGTTEFARTIQISEVTAECQRHGLNGSQARPYRYLSVRLQTWEFIPSHGQGALLLDATIAVKRRSRATDRGNFQSAFYAVNNIGELLSWFRSGGMMVNSPSAFPKANIDLGCPQ